MMRFILTLNKLLDDLSDWWEEKWESDLSFELRHLFLRLLPCGVLSIVVLINLLWVSACLVQVYS